MPSILNMCLYPTVPEQNCMWYSEVMEDIIHQSKCPGYMVNIALVYICRLALCAYGPTNCGILMCMGAFNLKF